MCFPSLYLKRLLSWQRQFLYLLFNNCQFGFVICSRIKLSALSGWLCACLTLANSQSVTARAASCHSLYWYGHPDLRSWGFSQRNHILDGCWCLWIPTSMFYRPEYHDSKHCKTNLRSKTNYYLLRSFDFVLPLRSFKVRFLKVSCACPVSPELSPPVRSLQVWLQAGSLPADGLTQHQMLWGNGVSMQVMGKTLLFLSLDFSTETPASEISIYWFRMKEGIKLGPCK